MTAKITVRPARFGEIVSAGPRTLMGESGGVIMKIDLANHGEPMEITLTLNRKVTVRMALMMLRSSFRRK